jgi:hypothetical protein
MPNSVTNAGNGTFAYCTNLASAHLSTNITEIGVSLFYNCPNLRGIAIPSGIVTIDPFAFCNDSGISSAIIPDSVTSIGGWAFGGCSLTELSIGNSVTNIGERAFLGSSTLTTSVTIPSSVTYIGDYAFAVCWRVPSFFFQGDAPTVGPEAFWDSFNATGYYLPGTTGWTNKLDALPTVLWNPQPQTADGSFGVQNNKFGFNVTGTTNIPIVVEACTNLANARWTPLQSCLVTNGSIYFNDPQYSKFPNRIYRIRSP